ncbi:IS110 family RNA-guided transposase [Microvirga lotononidis]|uniref:Transposase n=1 Tax=Microvirga lotononidis TaxID=864069 RepID=I4YKB5_9HYPH|nr:IS110 family transposase [Microvirga lotononidis]EIM24407.1 transposase [Microvirga lotononidis]WQO31330.1 IS110 family transposase [Microvirga lotononidis]
MQITTVGLDLAKHIFQVHAVDATGQVVVRKRLRRGEVLPFFAGLSPCLIGMEACATAHHWARELIKLGHMVKLMPPAYVKAYVKRGKTDAADAEAICEAVARPSMRFVPVKSAEQQSVLMLHRVRALLIRQRTMLVNALRGHLAEFGIIVAQGISRIRELIAILTDESADAVLPPLARRALAPLVDQLLDLQPRIRALEAELLAWHRQSQESRRLETIPGVGFITATAIAATVTDPSQFRSGREFAAWLGLTPRPNSSGGKERLGRISKMGDGYLRTLLVVGATAVIRYAHKKTAAGSAWIAELLARKPARLVSVALANKTARIAWALLARGEVYQAPAPAAV